MLTNDAVLQAAKLLCSVGKRPENLRAEVYKSLESNVDVKQWSTVWVTLGAELGLDNDGFIVITKCSQSAALALTARSPSPQITGKAKRKGSDTPVTVVSASKSKAWPAGDPERFVAVLVALAALQKPAVVSDVQSKFARVGAKRIEEMLEILVALRLVNLAKGKYTVAVSLS